MHDVEHDGVCGTSRDHTRYLIVPHEITPLDGNNNI